MSVLPSRQAAGLAAQPSLRRAKRAPQPLIARVPLWRHRSPLQSMVTPWAHCRRATRAVASPCPPGAPRQAARPFQPIFLAHARGARGLPRGLCCSTPPPPHPPFPLEARPFRPPSSPQAAPQRRWASPGSLARHQSRRVLPPGLTERRRAADRRRLRRPMTARLPPRRGSWREHAIRGSANGR